MSIEFTTDYARILERIDEIDPVNYGKSRNYVDGAVTYLSPYISRGVISTKQVLDHVLKKGFAVSEIESFVKELCWRDYFQRVGQHKNLNLDIKQAQEPVSNHEISEAIVLAQTGIDGIDSAIEKLYSSGYMHNHCRMYTASLVCNVAKSHWLLPAKWMYFHLLDGDWASNACSWQWVAGANSGKKYVANQENINKYTHTSQQGTFLDCSYESLADLETPAELLATTTGHLQTILPENTTLEIDESQPTLIYNYYNLDPIWRSAEQANRILLLEPTFFDTYPISEKCLEFMLSLANNIPGIQVFVGSFDALCEQYPLKFLYYKEHPLNSHYRGIEDSRDWISDEFTGYYPSFFAYWKKIEKELLLKYA
jgi:deoxyribodipyrimidine photo-lyase